MDTFVIYKHCCIKAVMGVKIFSWATTFSAKYKILSFTFSCHIEWHFGATNRVPCFYIWSNCAVKRHWFKRLSLNMSICSPVLLFSTVLLL